MAVVYQISACGTRPRAEKFLASSENVANVEMLPMANVANGQWHAACPWDVRSSFALRPCHVAARRDGSPHRGRDGAWEMLPMWKCESVEICKYGNVEMEWGTEWKCHCRAWFLRAVMMLAEKM